MGLLEACGSRTPRRRPAERTPRSGRRTRRSLSRRSTRGSCTGRRHEEDGLDLRGEALVEVGHLELPLVVGDRAQALDQRHAPHSRANSTTRVENPATTTFGKGASDFPQELASAPRRRRTAPCASGWRTTPTTTRSKRPAARRMTSRWPYVTGSYDPGQSAVRPAAVDGVTSGAMAEDLDVGGAVAAGAGRRAGRARAPGRRALEHDSAPGASTAGSSSPSAGRKPASGSVYGGSSSSRS